MNASLFFCSLGSGVSFYFFWFMTTTMATTTAMMMMMRTVRCSDQHVDSHMICGPSGEETRRCGENALTGDTQAVPLLPVTGARTDNGSVDLLVGLDDVVAHFLALLLNVLHKRLLLDDDLVQILEQLCQLNHLLFDLLNLLVTALDRAQRRLRLSPAVALHQLFDVKPLAFPGSCLQNLG